MTRATTWAIRSPRGSAIACALAQGMDLADAVNAGKAYLTGALAAGLNMGKGSGPVNHMWQY